MRLHREGNIIIAISVIIVLLISLIAWFIIPTDIRYILFPVVIFLLAIMLILVIQFFRVPKRTALFDHSKIVAPADGKVVVIEKITENEYFKDERIQISIFMSPLNVHVNWYPVNGSVVYSKYHPGKYLVAWHPKSSTENERTTVVIRTDNGKEIMVRQIAGAVARRICCYANESNIVKQGEELGFIKFGSRVDVIIPLDCEILTQINQITKGSLSPIACF